MREKNVVDCTDCLSALACRHLQASPGTPNALNMYGREAACCVILFIRNERVLMATYLELKAHAEKILEQAEACRQTLPFGLSRPAC
jgi:hypothetical protein